jgi:hypothetical protein
MDHWRSAAVHEVDRGGSPGGPRRLTRWTEAAHQVDRGGSPGGPRRSTCGFGRKIIAKIVSDTELMKNIPTYVCAKTASVGWPSTESRRNSSIHNFSSFNHCFIKYIKLVCRKSMVMVTLTTVIMFILFTCMHFWVWGILWRLFARAMTAYEVVSDCRKLEKHCLHQKIWQRFNFCRHFLNSKVPLFYCILCNYLPTSLS